VSVCIVDCSIASFLYPSSFSVVVEHDTSVVIMSVGNIKRTEKSKFLNIKTNNSLLRLFIQNQGAFVKKSSAGRRACTIAPFLEG
tara:strand:- start:590 stop:844 length:255 start_codon:yes stop_codon:yes gene_type:complete